MSKVISLYKEVEDKISDGCGNEYAEDATNKHFNSRVYTLARYTGTLLMGDTILQSRYNLLEEPVDKQKAEFKNVIQILPDRVECWIDGAVGFDFDKYLREECCLEGERVKIHRAPIEPGDPIGLISRLYGADAETIGRVFKDVANSHHNFSCRNGGEGVSKGEGGPECQ